ncbi:hypothetical protein AVDCRST_MAG94-6049 [uncultured Leptolyngbya sp.]|uniref:Uncharacterized protein n=1 Tax=uncultured Leptolyngbya sp. TaxID=332963 RepID=A0A6J4P3S1_9CYAN|nr:hypothetical protein AVDCRST_MAG94-6049 [uncultured Leptolyngbya sp.]
MGQADEKINQCVGVSVDFEPDIEQTCGPGVDPSFDQLISALGHVARQKPKALIDTLMYWRKAKSEATNVARAELNQVSFKVFRQRRLLTVQAAQDIKFGQWTVDKTQHRAATYTL